MTKVALYFFRWWKCECPPKVLSFPSFSLFFSQLFFEWGRERKKREIEWREDVMTDEVWHTFPSFLSFFLFPSFIFSSFLSFLVPFVFLPVLSIRLFFLRMVLSLIHRCLTIGYFFFFLLSERTKFVMTSQGSTLSCLLFLLPLFLSRGKKKERERETWTFQFSHDKFFPQSPFKQVGAPVKREKKCWGRERMKFEKIWERKLRQTLMTPWLLAATMIFDPLDCCFQQTADTKSLDSSSLPFPGFSYKIKINPDEFAEKL